MAEISGKEEGQETVGLCPLLWGRSKSPPKSPLVCSWRWQEIGVPPWGGACCRLEKRKRSGGLSSWFSAEREGSNGLGPGGAAGCLPLQYSKFSIHKAKYCLGLKIDSSTFFFFLNLIFFYFLYFWKRAISTSTQWGKSIILKLTR